MPSPDTIYYRKLFELRILHEYYLFSDNVRDYFILDDITREKDLNKLIINHRYDIWKDLIIEPSPSTRRVMDDRHIRFAPTKTGFVLGVRVNTANGKYYPFVDQGNDPLLFYIHILNPAFRNYTSLRLNSTVEARYFLSNADPESLLRYPSLSSPVNDFKSGQYYEQGDLAMIGGVTMEALTRTNSDQASDWALSNSAGVAHEGDRILLPAKFTYSFNRAISVSQADFTLKAMNGDTLKSIHAGSPDRLDRVFLNFSDALLAGQVYYTLDVTGDNGYQEIRRILSSDDFYHASGLGALEIMNTSGNPGFSLFDTDGSLKPAFPVFEIRLKSWVTYWRYRSNTGIRFKTSPKTSPFLVADNGSLKTRKPVVMAASPLEFRDTNPAIGNLYLPNPADQSLKTDAGGILYSDIYVSVIKDLILEDV
jgi:hypothetical protein